jgi:hypothetical protein
MTKYALLIGISYNKTSKKLKGTQNDIKSIYDLLLSWKFEKDNITVVAETKCGIGSFVSHKITNLGITSAINEFVSKLEPQDQAIIYYSGHGMLIRNMKGYVESSIVPIDHMKSGVITSETIRYYLNKIPEGTNVLCIFDCCNSGSICNLKYHIFDTSYKIDITKKMKKYDTKEWVHRQVDNVLNRDGSVSVDTDANVISISSCWNDQVSYDLIRNGALTSCLLSIFKTNKLESIEFRNLLQLSRGGILTMRLPQTPQIMCGRQLDLNIRLKDFLKI